MDSAKFLPVIPQAWQRVTLSHTTDFILICDDIHRQPCYLLLVARIIEIGVEYSVRRDHDLRRRGQLACTGRQRIHRLDSIIAEHRTEAVLDRKVPAVEGRMLSV